MATARGLCSVRPWLVFSVFALVLAGCLFAPRELEEAGPGQPPAPGPESPRAFPQQHDAPSPRGYDPAAHRGHSAATLRELMRGLGEDFVAAQRALAPRASYRELELDAERILLHSEELQDLLARRAGQRKELQHFVDDSELLWINARRLRLAAATRDAPQLVDSWDRLQRSCARCHPRPQP